MSLLLSLRALTHHTQTLSKRPTLLLALHPRSRLARSFLHTPSSQPLTLAIVGGGLSGLSSAYYFIQTLTPALRKACKVVVFEKQGRTGGWCRSLDVPLQEGEKGNMVFETGPRSIRPAGLQGWLTLEMVRPSLLPISFVLTSGGTQAHTIGLTPSILTVPKTSPSAKNRFILSPIPSDPAKSPLLLLPSSIFGALRAGLTLPLLRRALPSLLLEPFRRRSPLHDLPDGGDESVDSFFSRRFGRRLAEDLVSAGIHGVYSGDTRRLSIRAVFPGLWQAERERGSVILSAILGQKKGQAVSAYRANGVVENEEYEKIKQRMRGKDPKLVERLEEASVWGVEGGLEKMTDCLRDWLRAEGVEIRLGDEGSVSAVEKVDGYWSVSLSIPMIQWNVLTMILGINAGGNTGGDTSDHDPTLPSSVSSRSSPHFQLHSLSHQPRLPLSTPFLPSSLPLRFRLPHPPYRPPFSQPAPSPRCNLRLGRHALRRRSPRVTRQSLDAPRWLVLARWSSRPTTRSLDIGRTRYGDSSHSLPYSDFPISCTFYVAYSSRVYSTSTRQLFPRPTRIREAVEGVRECRCSGRRNRSCRSQWSGQGSMGSRGQFRGECE
jgi:hypothetical protein